MKKITLIVLFLVTTLLNAQEANYSIKNISANTKYSDFGVTYFGENSAIFASSRKSKSIKNGIWIGNKQSFLELYKGTVNEGGEINNVESFSKVLNSKFHESNVAFTKDLKTVYFSRNNYINNKVRKDSTGTHLVQLYRANINGKGEWTNIVPMPFNSDNYQTGHPVLNTEETKLYFVSDMPGSLGFTDIYVVDINSDGSFGIPQNLGSEINTTKREMFPYINDKGELYYSSDGFIDTKGGLDVYASKLGLNNTFSKPQNLPFPINSDKDDFGMVFKGNQKLGYFSSNRKGGKGDDDIYFFKELEPVKFECKQFAEGVVREDKSGALLPGALVELYSSDGNKLGSTIVKNDAVFSFELDCDTAFKIIGSKENHKEDAIEFTTAIKNILDLRLKKKTIVSNEFINVRGKLMISVNPIYFDINKSEIREDAALELDRVVRIMEKYPAIKIEGGSHTDSRGSDEFNQSLSARRAISTVNYIIEKGINPNRISAKGYGEAVILNHCLNGVKCTNQEHQINRRTEFVILNPDAINE